MVVQMTGMEVDQMIGEAKVILVMVEGQGVVIVQMGQDVGFPAGMKADQMIGETKTIPTPVEDQVVEIVQGAEVRMAHLAGEAVVAVH